VAEIADLVTVALDELLPRADGPESRLTEAMRYAALGPGKRLRPFFALEAAHLFDIEERPVLRAACALECVHAYSLVHDDLPCMDDDDVRRGRPTVHRAYDEATAVLAGDALQTAAFDILLDEDTHDDAEIRCELAARLSLASGARGMAGGQMIDLLGVRDDLGGRGQDAAAQDRGPVHLRLRDSADHRPGP
jgi:farnesyl diphosphate synthase